MTILQTGVTLPLNLKAGETLVIKELSGTSTVTGSTASREDASTSIGAGFVVYGPQPSDCSVTLTTTGAADWFVEVGDATPGAAVPTISVLASMKGQFVNQVISVGPDASGQFARWYWNGSRWRPASGIIAMKNTAGSVTDAGASEQNVYSIVIPAGLIGPTDDWYVDHFWQWPNSATTKTVRVKFGGTTIASLAATTTASGRGTTHIYMRDSKTAQVFANATAAIAWQEGQTSGSAPSTATVDTNSDITISLTGQWGTAGAGSNLITLERVAVGIKFAY